MISDDRGLPTRRACLTAGGLLLASSAVRADGALAPTYRPIRLSLNENNLGPSPKVAAALGGSLDDLHRYVGQDEVDILSAQIARLEGVSPAQVVLGEVLAPLGLHLARQHQGGNILYSSPGYTELVDAAVPFGGSGIPIPLNAHLENDLAAFSRSIDTRTIAVSLVNPHNPSGTVNDAVALDAFIEAAAKRTLVIVDEAYLEYDDLAGRSAIRFTRAGANVVVFRTLAKIYGLAGLAIGYAIVPLALAFNLKKAGLGDPHVQNRLALIAATVALADQAHVAAIRATIMSERERVTRILDTLGLARSDSRASFVFYRSPRDAADDRAAFLRAGIEVARPFPPLDDWIRITVGRPEENDAVISALRTLYSRHA